MPYLAQGVFAFDAVEGGGQALEDGCELEPVLAAAFLVGEFLKLGGERDTTFVESGELFVGSELGSWSGRGSGAAERGDGSGQPAGVFRDHFDHFAVEVKGALADGGSKSAVSGGGNGRQLGELEIGGAELLPQTDDLVGVSAVDAEVAGTEFAPAGGDELKLVGLAQAVEAGGLGR